MTREEKIEIVKDLTGDKLLEAYDIHVKTFNPFDDERVENYNVIKYEVLRRLNKEDWLCQISENVLIVVRR